MQPLWAIDPIECHCQVAFATMRQSGLQKYPTPERGRAMCEVRLLLWPPSWIAEQPLMATKQAPP